MDKTRPKWIDKYVGKGQTTRCKNGVYYLCSYHTEYSKEKGRGVTVIDGYLGRLDEERGLIPKKVKRDGLVITAPVEYGANAVLDRLCHEIYENLELCFGEQDAKEIFAIAKFGLSDKQPECRIDNAYLSSYESVRNPNLSLSGSSISRLTERIGLQRERQISFMRKYSGSDYVIFDGTRLVCYSKNSPFAEIGYNHSGIWDPQGNLMYCYSLSPTKMPIYYSINPGNQADIALLKDALREFGIANAIAIMDKGFPSESNYKALDECGVGYISPLKRNAASIDYSFMKESIPELNYGECHFTHHKKTVFYRIIQEYREADEGKGLPRKDLIILYFDSYLYNEERSTYVSLSMKGKDYKETIVKAFGTMTIRSSKDFAPEELYAKYKERELCEDGNKAYKHVLDKMTSNKENGLTYQGWLFINHVSLMMYYCVFNEIKRKGLDYSVEEVIDSLKRVTYQKLGEDVIIREPAKKIKRVYMNLFDREYLDWVKEN